MPVKIFGGSATSDAAVLKTAPDWCFSCDGPARMALPGPRVWRNGGQEAQGAYQWRIDESRILCLADATIHPGKYVMKGSVYVQETLTNIMMSRVLTDEEHRAGGTDDPLVHPKWRVDSASSVRHMTNEHIICWISTPFSGNFGHWHIEALCGIEMMRKHDIAFRLVVPPLSSWQREVLHYAGYPAGSYDELSSLDPFLLDRVAIPSSCWLYRNRLFGKNPRYFGLFRSIRDCVLRETGGEARPRRIYLSRGEGSHARNRVLKNEAEVEALFRRHGFVSVIPERLPYAEQVRLFAEAEVIAGPSGAAFTLLAFCDPSVRVLELSYETGWWRAWHEWMCGFGGVSHDVYIEHQRNIDMGPARNDGHRTAVSWTVDVGQLNDFVGAVGH